MIHQNTQSQSQLNQLDANEGVSNTRLTADPPGLPFFLHPTNAPIVKHALSHDCFEVI